jgi:hypothetical protein
MDRKDTAGPSAPLDFLSKAVASVDVLRLSLRRAAYVAAGKSGYASTARRDRRDDKWAVVTFIWGRRSLRDSISQQRRLHVPFDIDIGIVRNVEHNFFDCPASELRLRSILAAYGITAVVADTQSLTA